LVQGMQRIWSWFDSTVAEPLRDIPETWRGNLENLRIIEAQAAAHGWFAYDRTINQFIYDRLRTWRDNFAMLNTIWTEKLWAVQEPGLPADGPISAAMLTMSALDSNGIPISPVGADLVRLIDERGGVGVHFSDVITDGTAGVTPFKGLVVLPNAYTDPSTQSLRVQEHTERQQISLAAAGARNRATARTLLAGETTHRTASPSPLRTSSVLPSSTVARPPDSLPEERN